MANLHNPQLGSAFAQGFPDRSHINSCFTDSKMVISNLHCNQVYSQIAARKPSERLLPDIRSANVPVRWHKMNSKPKVRELQINGGREYDTFDSTVQEYRLAGGSYTGMKTDYLEWMEVEQNPALQAEFEKEQVIVLSEWIDRNTNCAVSAFAGACTSGNEAQNGVVDLGTATAPVGIRTFPFGTATNTLAANEQYIHKYLMNGKNILRRLNYGDKALAVVLPYIFQEKYAESAHVTNAQLGGNESGYIGACPMIKDRCGMEAFSTSCICPVGKTASGQDIYEIKWIVKEDFDMAQGVIEEFRGKRNEIVSSGVYSLVAMRHGSAVLRPESVVKGYVYFAD